MRKTHDYLVYLLLVVTLAFSQAASAQSDRKTARKAENSFLQANFERSAELYGELAQKHPDNFEYNLRAGISCYYTVDVAKKTKAIPYLEAAQKLMGTDTVPELYYYLGQTYHLADRYDDAITFYQKLRHYIEIYNGDTVGIKEIAHYIEMCENAKELVKNPENVQIQNLGENVNSPYMDYAPTLPADGSVMAFTSRRAGTTGGKKDLEDLYFEDIYFAKSSNGAWQAAENAGSVINTKKHDASVVFSRDGKRLYMYRHNDIWLSEYGSIGWGNPRKLLPDVNSKSFEPSITLTADEATIYFVSERKGGYGGKDIYVSNKQPDGSWSTAKNLGPAINTPYDEESPYLSPDGKTFYFSSQGHTSMGGYDVFVSTMSNGEWSSAKSLGYPVNSVWDDIFYVQGTNGNSYYSSIKPDTKGDLNIYRISYAQKKKGVKLLLVAKNNAAKDASRAHIKLTSDSSSYESDLAMGVQHFDSLVPGRAYTLEVAMEGYKAHRITFKLPEQKEDEEYYQEVLFEQQKDASGTAAQRTTFYNAFFDIDEEAAKANIKTGSDLDNYSMLVRKIDTASTALDLKIYSFTDQTPPLAGNNSSSAGMRDSLRFAPVLFDYQRSLLRPEATAQLTALYEYLKANKDVKLEVHGHTDAKGAEQFNTALSVQRAETVASWLKSKGIAASRIKVTGHAGTQPVAPNQNPDGSDNPGGRQQNRRVQFILVTPAK